MTEFKVMKSAMLPMSTNMKKQTFHKGKASNPDHVRELNRKAQTNLRTEAMQSSNLNHTENPQGKDSIRHSMSKMIQSFHDKITHGPEYL